MRISTAIAGLSLAGVATMGGALTAATFSAEPAPDVPVKVTGTMWEGYTVRNADGSAYSRPGLKVLYRECAGEDFPRVCRAVQYTTSSDDMTLKRALRYAYSR